MFLEWPMFMSSGTVRHYIELFQSFLTSSTFPDWDPLAIIVADFFLVCKPREGWMPLVVNFFVGWSVMLELCWLSVRRWQICSRTWKVYRRRTRWWKRTSALPSLTSSSCSRRTWTFDETRRHFLMTTIDRCRSDAFPAVFVADVYFYCSLFWVFDTNFLDYTNSMKAIKILSANVKGDTA